MCQFLVDAGLDMLDEALGLFYVDGVACVGDQGEVSRW